MRVLAFVFLCVTVYGQHIPHGHDLKDAIDHVYGRLDSNPHDDNVDLVEFEYVTRTFDANNDSCVSEAEYLAKTKMDPGLAVQIYKELNVIGGDDCLSIQDLIVEYHIIDTNRDGRMSKHEFEHYFTRVVGHLFHGHAVG